MSQDTYPKCQLLPLAFETTNQLSRSIVFHSTMFALRHCMSSVLKKVDEASPTSVGNSHPVWPQCDCLVTFSIKAKAIFSNHTALCGLRPAQLQTRDSRTHVEVNVYTQRRRHTEHSSHRNNYERFMYLSLDALKDDIRLEADGVQKSEHINVHACIVGHLKWISKLWSGSFNRSF